MSADAASLPCPICLHTGVFNSAQALKDRLIYVSTNNIMCPICQESLSGLDKLTIHLFSHVSFLSSQGSLGNGEKTETKSEAKQGNQIPPTTLKKTRTAPSKNKALASPAPVKFVKIYPKLPVIALNTVPLIDIQSSVDGCIQNNNPMYIPPVKAETATVKTDHKCNVCGLRFIDSNILKMHKCLLHNLDDKSDNTFSSYNCHLCPKTFKMRGSLMVHLRVAHYGFPSQSTTTKKLKEKTGKGEIECKPTTLDRSDGKQWQCDVCRKSFTTKYFLKKHKRLHTGETPYACTQCNKTFTFQQSYHKHLLYHNDEKPHVCNYCNRAFKELSTLHNHQRIHTGEKPFSCETCGKCFRQRVSYLVHRRIHTGAMPYKCTACKKSFRYKVSQRTHKCQAQPPGTVVRQSGELVEKLKKKYVNDPVSKTTNEGNCNNLNYIEISEANAELVRTGAKLSLEDIESDGFSIIAEAFTETNRGCDVISDPDYSTRRNDSNATEYNNYEMFGDDLEDLIDSVPINDKNIPSPSDILKNLCLTNDDDYIQ
ncbi:Zinc finger protein 235 [Papilio machaon]|uniref:Zinc finger protein 235 n=1 Tax=Papilio machaon TaxID=76193 RepID=A0A194R894_PAPMA|nr:Zinc finger protein 235 [Papilio machaon]